MRKLRRWSSDYRHHWLMTTCRDLYPVHPVCSASLRMSMPKKPSHGESQKPLSEATTFTGVVGATGVQRGHHRHLYRHGSPIMLAFACPDSGSSHLLLPPPGTLLSPIFACPTPTPSPGVCINSLLKRASLNPTFLEQVLCQSHSIHGFLPRATTPTPPRSVTPYSCCSSFNVFFPPKPTSL